MLLEVQSGSVGFDSDVIPYSDGNRNVLMTFCDYLVVSFVHNIVHISQLRSNSVCGTLKTSVQAF